MTRLGLGVGLSVLTVLGIGFVACVGDDPPPSTAADGDASSSQDGSSGGPNVTDSGDSDGSKDDREGGTPAGPGAFLWELHADRAIEIGTEPERLTTLAVGPNDVIGVSSEYKVSTAIGPFQVAEGGTRALPFVLGADKTAKWALGLPIELVNAVAVDGAGNIYIAGAFLAPSITLGSKTLTNKNSSPQSESGFYAKLSGVDGSVLWAVSLSDTNGEYSRCTSLGVRGTDVVVGCNFYGPIAYPSTNSGIIKQVPDGDDVDLVVIAVDPSDNAGQSLWSRRVHGGGFDAVSGVAFDTTGNVLAVGTFDSPNVAVDTGPVMFTKGGSALNAFLLRFDGAGTHAVSLAKNWYGSGSQATVQPNAIAIAPTSGDIGICGHFFGAVNFGQGEIPAPAGLDAFVMRLDSGGTARWVKTFGGSGNDICRSIAFDSFDKIAIGGTHRSGSVSISGQALPAMTGSSAGYVAKLSATGEGLWAHAVNGTNATVGGVAFLSGGDVVYSGAFLGTTDLGAGSIQSASGGTKSSLFVVRRAP